MSEWSFLGNLFGDYMVHNYELLERLGNTLFKESVGND